MLTQLLRHGSLRYRGGFCNLMAGRVVPLTIGTNRRSRSIANQE
jgi:hypothetical protein